LPPYRDALADREPRRAIRDHLAPRLRDRPPESEAAPRPTVARPGEPDEREPRMRALHLVRHEWPRRPHSRDRARPRLDVARNPRRLREGPARVALHDPE